MYSMWKKCACASANKYRDVYEMKEIYSASYTLRPRVTSKLASSGPNARRPTGNTM